MSISIKGMPLNAKAEITMPVPTPHGKLINPDSLEINYLHIRNDGMKIYTQRANDNAPTIIPASVGEEG